MNPADLVRTVLLIMRSQPEELVRFADRYARVAGQAEEQRVVAGHGIDDIQALSSGQTERAMGIYRRRIADGLDMLGQASQDVVNGLENAASHISAIRQSLYRAINSFGLSEAGAGIGSMASLSPVIVLAAAAAGGTIPFAHLINLYRQEMTALSGAMSRANAKMDSLDSVVRRIGGLLPEPPVVRPG